MQIIILKLTEYRLFEKPISQLTQEIECNFKQHYK
jgi:hypothetical protein